MFSFLNKNYKKVFIIAVVVFGLLGGNLAMAQSEEQPAAQGGVDFGLGDAFTLLVNPGSAPLLFGEKALQLLGVMDKGGASAANVITAGFLAVVLKVVAFVVMIVNYLLALLGSALFTFGGWLVEVGLELNASVLNSSIVEVGWTLVRNFTNLGFVLAIIYISFVIMLRIETYEIKKVVAKLLLAAILINFSLTIVGVFLNVSDTVSNFFISKATGEAGFSSFKGLAKMHEFAKNISGITNIQSLSKIGTNFLEVAKNGVQPDLGLGYIAILIKLVLVALFTVLSTIVMFLLAFMVLLRYFVLTALLIIAPAAWLCFAVPKLYPYFIKWWNVVLKWVFFLPVTAFFLYLAIVVVYNPNLQANKNSPAAIAKQIAKTPDYVTDITGDFESFAQMILSLALMITGLIAGEKLGVIGAAGTLAGAKSAKDWVVGTMPGAVGRFGLRQALTSFQEKDEKGNVKSTLGQRLATISSRYGLTGISQTFDKYGAIDIGAPVDKQKKRFESFKPQTLMLFAQDAARLSEAEAAGLAKVLADKNMLNKLSNEQIEELAKKSEKFGVAKEIYKVRPDLAPNPREVLKGMGPGQKAALSTKVFENYDVVMSLSNKDLERISRDAGEEVMDKIQSTLLNPPATRDPKTIEANLPNVARINKFIRNNIAGQTEEEA